MQTEPSDDLIGRTPKMVALRQQVHSLLARSAGLHLPPILITGETGTGKGLLARLVHRQSSRSRNAFVELNGAAIPEHLVESELFGHERGAFTDAREARAGLFQAAHRGILFLDEVGLLPLATQAKLLKVLEDGTVRRLGATRSEIVDVCLISATNEDLTAAVRARRFREDLYHRLAVVTLALPPLRERGDDIALLAEHALAAACKKYGMTPKRLDAQAEAAMRAYRWPGNVRELNSVIERAVLLCVASVIPASALGLEEAEDAPSARPFANAAESERQHLEEVLAHTGWNISRTAAILGITRNTVRARIARYGLRIAGSAEPAADAPATAEPGVSPSEDDPIAAEPRARPLAADAAPARVGPPLERRAGGVPAPVEAPSGRPSIAVLPFRVEEDEQVRGYYGDGIVEDIIGALASLRDLLVISRSSTLRYRGTSPDIRVVGREVGVSYVLSGSLRRSGNRLRVSGELAETARGTVLWASHFDGIAEDLFALQDQISTRVVSTIAPHVREAEFRRALRKRPGSMEAYDCVLRALAQLYRLNPQDFADTRTWLERAIALDPAYATPYALMAIWHATRVHQGWSPDPVADFAEVLRLSTAAIERDSFDATALALCGHAKSTLLYEFDEAIALFDRAIEASPSSPVVWTRSSPTYSYLGDADEAIRRAQQGIRLSPFDPHVFYPHTSLGIGYYVAGDHEEGARWGKVAQEENPRYTANLRMLAANLAAADRLDEAREVSQSLLAVEPAFQVGRFVDAYAIRDPERRERLARHLRLAGLPG